MRMLLILLFGILPAIGAAVFVPPDETRVLFRRDLLPIDPDTMRVLSQQLTELARRDAGDDPVQTRAAAQLLALATRLDPANRPARDLTRQLAGGSPPPTPDQRALERATAETWHIVTWLLHDDAGAEGRLLGHQILDALRVIDPNHPAARNHDAPGEAKRWSGVVAAVARFRKTDEPPPAPEPPADPVVVPSPVPDPSSMPEDPDPPEPPAPVRLRQASVFTPLYTYDKNYQQHLGLVPLNMLVQEDENGGRMTLALLPEFDSPLLESMRLSVASSLHRSWPSLPRNERVVFSTKGERYASRNGSALSGPMALLLHAALTGKSLREDLHFLGEVDAKGALVAPQRGWDLLRGLRNGKGGLLLVPSAFQQDLRALLVLEEPEFFVKYEVLAVSSLDTALALGSTDDPPEGLAEASALFKTVRAAASKTPVGQLAVNKIFRGRLGEIRDKAPYHLSAAMLLLQGSGDRPTRLESGILARSIKHTMETIAWVARAEAGNLDPGKVEAAWTEARRQLDPLEKFIEREDAGLHKEAVEVVNALRTMARSRRLDLQGESSFHQRQLYDSHLRLKDGLTRLQKRIAPLTGDPVPEGPAPEAPAPRKSEKED